MGVHNPAIRRMPVPIASRAGMVTFKGGSIEDQNKTRRYRSSPFDVNQDCVYEIGTHSRVNSLDLGSPLHVRKWGCVHRDMHNTLFTCVIDQPAPGP